jgi:hypothetical protein
MSAKSNRTVRFVASIALIPKAVASLPKAAVESVKVFKEDVKDEMDFRCAQARLVDRDVKEA